MMVDKVEAPDASTVVFHLKFATSAFLPALADPYRAGSTRRRSSIRTRTGTKRTSWAPARSNSPATRPASRSRACATPIITVKGLPYLDGFTGIFASKQATRIDALRADRAAIEFRGLPPSARDELVKELGDKITVQDSDWNCGSVVTINEKVKPFDDVRVRRALTLAIDRWGGVPALSKIADVQTVGSIVFPGVAAGADQGRAARRSPGSGPTSRNRGPRRSGC